MTLIASRGSCVAVIGAVLLAGCTNLPVLATTPEPLFDTVTRFETTIPTANGAEDAADIYYPGASEAVSLPLALLLPGGLVDKAEYSDFASMVAGYGFVVVVPNRFRSVPNPVSGEDFSGLIAQVEQVNDVLNYVEAENARPESPLRDRVDVSQLGLLGHSWGGAVGLAAIQNLCLPLLCTESFERPKALKAGVFYGTTFRDQSQEEVVILPVANQGIPIGLIAGDRDGVVRGAMDAVAQTYENIQDPPKALITLRGANHYSITNEDSNRDRVRSTLDQEVATETIARWSGLFLRAHLLEDSEAWNYIYQSGDRLDPNVDVESIP